MVMSAEQVQALADAVTMWRMQEVRIDSLCGRVERFLMTDSSTLLVRTDGQAVCES